MTTTSRFRVVRRAGPVIAVLVVSGAILVALAVLPVSSWMKQRSDTREAKTDLVRVEAEVSELQAKLALLQTDAEVERMARENFDLVFPGEESYRVLPAPHQVPAESPLQSPENE